MYSAFECGRLTAGPDVIRPNTSTRSFFAWPITGFPIDGLDRFASKASSPLQFVNALYISSSLPRRAPLGSFSKLRRLIGAAMDHQRPGRARHLVGERHRHDLEGS